MNPSIEQQRRECRQRWAGERVTWRMWKAVEIEHAAHPYQSVKNARERMRWWVAARADIAARAARAEKAVLCSAWSGELEAALCMVEGWREDADEESAPVYAAELVWLRNLIAKLVASGRRHSPNDPSSPTREDK